jgi:hypothetical protein
MLCKSLLKTYDIRNIYIFSLDSVLRKYRTKNDYCRYEDPNIVARDTVSTGSDQVFSDSLTLKKKSRRSFKAIYRLVRRHIPEDFSLHELRCKNLKTRPKPCLRIRMRTFLERTFHDLKFVSYAIITFI